MGVLVWIGLGVLALVVRYYVKQKAENPKGLPLPPGPPPLPIIGNLKDIPQDKAWLKYDAMTKQYGTPPPTARRPSVSPTLFTY